MKASKIAVKVSLRILLILIVVIIVSYYQTNNARLQNLHLALHSWLTLISPAILIIAFFILFIVCLRNKYERVDINWLLTLNTVILIVFVVALSLRIYHMVA